MVGTLRVVQLTRVAALAVAVLCSGARAVQTEDMTPAERAVLPRWCEFTQTFDRSPRAPGRYEDHLARHGPGWAAVHHYCWAIASLVRQSQASNTDQNRRFLAQSALRDIDYVLRNSPADFFMRYDILLRKGRVLLGEKANAKAIETANEMVQMDPRRSEGHALLAEAHLAGGRAAEAARILDSAAEQVSDPERLRQFRQALKIR